MRVQTCFFPSEGWGTRTHRTSVCRGERYFAQFALPYMVPAKRLGTGRIVDSRFRGNDSDRLATMDKVPHGLLWGLRMGDTVPRKGWGTVNRASFPHVTLSEVEERHGKRELSVGPTQQARCKSPNRLSRPFDSAQDDLKDSNLQTVMVRGVEPCSSFRGFFNRPNRWGTGRTTAVSGCAILGVENNA